MTKLIGYMEGTDPLWLTTLQLLGYDTLPLSNGQDGHGLNIQLITQNNRPDLIICWLHKLVWPCYYEVTPKELLHSTQLYNIPVLVACPAEHHNKVAGLLGEMPANVRLVAPDQILDTVKQTLQ